MKEKTIKSDLIYNGRILTLKKEFVELPNGVQANREIIEHRPAVIILPYEPPDKIYLIKQYRHAVRKVLIEVPAGIMEPNEQPLDSAQRELEEETGFQATEWTFLSENYPSPGFCNEYLYFYLAKNLTKTATNFDEDEIIHLEKYTIAEVEELIRNKEIIDGKTILAFLLSKKYFSN